MGQIKGTCPYICDYDGTRERKRAYNAPSAANVLTGVVVEWRIDDEQFNEVTNKYFDDKDRKLLAVK